MRSWLEHRVVLSMVVNAAVGAAGLDAYPLPAATRSLHLYMRVGRSRRPRFAQTKSCGSRSSLALQPRVCARRTKVPLSRAPR